MKRTIFLLIVLFPFLSIAQFGSPVPVAPDAKFLHFPDLKNQVHITLYPQATMGAIQNSLYKTPESNESYYKDIIKSQAALKKK